MGGVYSSALRKLVGSKDIRVLLFGLDASGKTSILYKLKLGEFVCTIPSIGFNVETLHTTNANITVWDMGGRDKIRGLWKHYYAGTDAIVFVIDSTDEERLLEARAELQKVVSEEVLSSCALLVVCNKQDLNNALTVSDITERLGLESLLKHTVHRIQGCSAKLGSGLEEGLSWLQNVLSQTSAMNAVVGNDKSNAGTSTWWSRWWYGSESSSGEDKNRKTVGDSKKVQQQSKQHLEEQQEEHAQSKDVAAVSSGDEYVEERIREERRVMEGYSGNSRFSSDDILQINEEQIVQQVHAHAEGEQRALLPLLDAFGHLQLLALIHFYIRTMTRRLAVNKIFEELESLSKSHTQANGQESGVYKFHYTLTYFWIQMVHHAMAVAKQRAEEKDEEGTQTVSLETLVGEARYLLDENLPLRYYRSSTLFAELSVASTEMVMPDLVPLPNVLV